MTGLQPTSLVSDTLHGKFNWFQSPVIIESRGVRPEFDSWKVHGGLSPTLRMMQNDWLRAPQPRRTEKGNWPPTSVSEN